MDMFHAVEVTLKHKGQNAKSFMAELLIYYLMFNYKMLENKHHLKKYIYTKYKLQTDKAKTD